MFLIRVGGCVPKQSHNPIKNLLNIVLSGVMRYACQPDAFK